MKVVIRFLLRLTLKKETPGVLPGLFKSMHPRETASGDIIFREGETSNFFYSIVEKRYNVLVNDRSVSVLTPDDIFEVKFFLLNNDRKQQSLQNFRVN
jgi:CRP-like cAMP-binding protein